MNYVRTLIDQRTRVHASLYPSCHHQIIHTKFNLNASHPHHTSVLYGIKNSQIQKKIRKALDLINWERLFNKKDIGDAQVTVFDKTILNVLRNYVINKYINIDDKDPVWMNETIKLKIKAKNNMYKK